MRYSVIVPVYNEEKNIPELYRRLSGVMTELCQGGGEYEIILIDDGSGDGSGKKIAGIADRDEAVKVIAHESNKGQSAAIFAGVSAARGEVIITLDGDLQNPPEEIPALVGMIEQGYDAVSGWRHSRDDPFIKKKLPSYASNWLARNLYGVELHDFGCTLKAYRRETLADMPYWDGVHRFMIGIVALRGYKVAERKIEHGARGHGETKYGASRLIVGLLDLLYIRFIGKPKLNALTVFTALGLGMFMMAALTFGISRWEWEPYVKTNLLILALPLTIMAAIFTSLGYIMNIRYRYGWSDSGSN